MMRRCVFGAMVVLIVVAGLGLCPGQTSSALTATTDAAKSDVTTSSASGMAAPQFQTRYYRYQLRAGDQFDVSFDLSPEFNQTVSVQPDGFVTLRGVGDVRVAGQTVPEVTETLKKAYGNILNDPPIVVILKDFERPYFVANGQVTHPGKYELRGDVTLTEAIAMAGGFTDTSKHSQVLLFRRVSDQWLEAKVINVKEMLKKGNLHEDPYVHPGDMLYVPKNTISKIQRYFPNLGFGGYFPIP